jgi:site-specific DNA-methyltransferase (adenine-specific)
MKDFGHPAMFPEEIPRRLLKLFSYQNDLVLDPFNGVGTTTLAAWKNNRRFIGIEISPEYCREALDRIIRSGVPTGSRCEPEIVSSGDQDLPRG